MGRLPAAVSNSSCGTVIGSAAQHALLAVPTRAPHTSSLSALMSCIHACCCCCCCVLTMLYVQSGEVKAYLCQLVPASMAEAPSHGQSSASRGSGPQSVPSRLPPTFAVDVSLDSPSRRATSKPMTVAQVWNPFSALCVFVITDTHTIDTPHADTVCTLFTCSIVHVC